MRKDIGMDFVDCHSCGNEIDVTKQVLIFNSNGTKQVIKKACDKCGSMSQLVIPMVGGITSIELLNKRRA